MMVRCVFWQFLKDAKHDVPEHLNYGRLLKELQKEIRAFDRDLRASDGEIHSVSCQIRAFDQGTEGSDGEIHSVSCQICAFDRELRALDGEIHSVSYQIRAFNRDLRAPDGEIHSVSCPSSMAVTFIDQERL